MVYNLTDYTRKRKSVDGDGAENAIPIIKKKTSFQPDWLRDPQLKDWLQRHPTDSQKAICKYCVETISFSRKSHLIDHSKTNKHLQNIKAAQALDTFVTVDVEGPTFRDKVHVAELKTALFIAEHNVGVKLVDDLVPFMKNMCIDPEPVQNMKMKEDKCSQVIKEILYKSTFDELKEVLNNNAYSILVDESTAIGNVKLLCVCVQYFSKTQNKVVQHLLQLIELDGKKGTALDIFTEFKAFFDKHNINMQNIIALACDNASIMTGKIKGFYALLKKVVNHCLLINCICHSSALVAKTSCSMIPKKVEELLRSVSFYFSNSPKRFAEYLEIVRFLNLPPLKMLKLSGTRWLEAYCCYDRVHLSFPALVNYFSIEAFEMAAPKLSKETVTTTEGGEVKVSSPERILELLLDPSVRVYVAFMKYALNYHNSFNAFYQKKGLMIHKLYASIEKLLEQVGQDFLNPESLSQITSENFIVRDHVKPLKDVFLGASATDLLNEIAADVTLEIKQNCLNYNITCMEEMRKRFLEHRNLLSSLSFVEPKIALSLEEREKYPYLKGITTFFPYIDADSLAFEWRALPLQFDRDTIIKYIELDVESFWSIIFNLKNDAGTELCFPSLTKLVQAVFSLPHSNAEPEQTFSDVNEVKDLKGNKTSTALLNARCFLRSYGHAYNINSLTYQPSEKQLSIFTTQNLYPKKNQLKDE